MITDENGLYFITVAAAGPLHADRVLQQQHVLARQRPHPGRQGSRRQHRPSTARLLTPLARPRARSSRSTGTAPIIDQGSTKTGVTITARLHQQHPDRPYVRRGARRGGRHAERLLRHVDRRRDVGREHVHRRGHQHDGHRASVGCRRTCPTSSSQETEVITGGYNAEYGRATGGIVNVVTKQGSNEFHGSVFGYYTPGSFSRDAKTIQREGGSIDTQHEPRLQLRRRRRGRRSDHQGQAVVPRRLQPVATHADDHAPRPVAGRRRPGRRPRRRPERPGFTIHKPVAQPRHPEASNDVLLHREDQRRDRPEQPVPAVGVRQPAHGVDDRSTIASDDLTFAPDDNLFNRNDGAYDVSAKYTSKLNDGKTQIDARRRLPPRLHRHDRRANDHGASALTYYNYARSLYDFADLEGADAIAACQRRRPPNDPYPKIAQLPGRPLRRAGPRLLEKRTNDRTSAIVVGHPAREGPRLPRVQGRRRHRARATTRRVRTPAARASPAVQRRCDDRRSPPTATIRWRCPALAITSTPDRPQPDAGGDRAIQPGRCSIRLSRSTAAQAVWRSAVWSTPAHRRTPANRSIGAYAPGLVADPSRT